MAGKADAIVQRSDGMYLLEHKTAASIDGNYLDKLWTDTQIALYCYYLRELGYPIVGVIYVDADFDVLYDTAMVTRFGRVPTIRLLLRSKLTAGRPKDLRHTMRCARQILNA